MWKQLKSHFESKRNDFKKIGKRFQDIQADSTFVIRIQDGTYHHTFTIKITPECNIHTQFMIKSHVSKEVADFIMRFNIDLMDDVYIPVRDRYVMLVLSNQVHWIGFSPFHPLTLSLYQAEKLVQQLYELKFKHFQRKSIRAKLTYD
jgi:hypothetical protein